MVIEIRARSHGNTGFVQHSPTKLFAVVGKMSYVGINVESAVCRGKTINDGDSMLQERKISLETEVQLQARISLSGSPAAASGDWQSAPVVVPLSAGDTVELILDQQVE